VNQRENQYTGMVPSATNPEDFGPQPDMKDSKNVFICSRCKDKDVLDLGTVMHDPENYRSKYWAHNAIRQVAKSLIGLDLYKEGVDYLNERGYQVVHADAQNFDLGTQFDVIVAGDVVEHLENFDGFLESVKAHLRPTGKLIITTPNPWYWKMIIKGLLSDFPLNNPEHSCWFCPTTLSQLVRRHGMKVTALEHFSRYLSDRLLPLPKRLKHTSFGAEIIVV
jgi:SAM-dependent methyltransferase